MKVQTPDRRHAAVGNPVEPIFGKLKEWARTLKRQSLVVYSAARDSRAP